MAKMGTWSVGVVEITGESDDEKGVAVLVVDEDEGGLIANDVFPGASEGDAMKQSLETLFAEMGRPRKIVVKTGEQSKALRASGLRETIAVGATPGLDAVMKELEESLDEMLDAPGPLDGEGATAEHLRDFFGAAEVMRAVSPWLLFPPATGFVVEVPDLQIDEGGVFLVTDEPEEEEEERGDDDEAMGPGGWMFVDSPEDFEAMTSMVMEGGGHDRASVIALSYEREEDLGDAFQEFAREHGLEVSASGWVPMLMRTKRGEGVVAVSGREYELATAICTAIARIGAELADGEDELEPVRAELVTRGGMEVAVEGPIDDEGEEEDEGGDAA